MSDWRDSGYTLSHSAVTDSINKPSVRNSVGAKSITANSARLTGEITNTGGENPTIRIYYGTSDGDTNPGLWDHYAEGAVGLGSFYVDLSGLSSGTKYYYKCYASNSAGSNWASGTATFTTLQGPNNTPSIPTIHSGPTTGNAGISRATSSLLQIPMEIRLDIQLIGEMGHLLRPVSSTPVRKKCPA